MLISLFNAVFRRGKSVLRRTWRLRYQMLRTAEMAGGTVMEDRQRHYKISTIFMVGEATALAMRTNIKR